MTLAVTGGIGSGKSLVCSLFARMGIPVYDSDSRTKTLYDEDPELVAAISSVLGTDVSAPGGGVDRESLACLVFGNPEMLAKLESVVHPAVKRDFIRWRESAEGPFAVLESAIILEKPLFNDAVDRILLVDAPVEVRLSRAAGRDGAEESVRRKMSSQRLLNDISMHKVSPEVDFRIDNTGDILELEKETEKIYRKIIEEIRQ